MQNWYTYRSVVICASRRKSGRYDLWLISSQKETRLPCNKFSYFKELLENSKVIETSLQESSIAKGKTDFEKIRPKEVKKSVAFENKIRPRCAYYNNF